MFRTFGAFGTFCRGMSQPRELDRGIVTNAPDAARVEDVLRLFPEILLRHDPRWWICGRSTRCSRTWASRSIGRGLRRVFVLAFLRSDTDPDRSDVGTCPRLGDSRQATEARRQSGAGRSSRSGSVPGKRRTTRSR